MESTGQEIYKLYIHVIETFFLLIKLILVKDGSGHKAKLPLLGLSPFSIPSITFLIIFFLVFKTSYIM